MGERKGAAGFSWKHGEFVPGNRREIGTSLGDCTLKWTEYKEFPCAAPTSVAFFYCVPLPLEEERNRK